MRFLKRLFKNSERGQALAEYMPLMPPVLFLSAVIMVPLSENTSMIFCRMVNSMEPEKCAMAEYDDGVDLGDIPEPTALAPEEGDDCVVLQQEQGGSQCDQSDLCSVLPGLNNASYTASEELDNFVIKAGQGYHVYEPGDTNDGCYEVSLHGNNVSWQKVGHGPSCKDVSHAQAWKTTLCIE
jgi:hypothetical protein